MFAASNDFLHSSRRPPGEDAAFTGEWVLDRISGLVDSATAAIQRVRIDAHALHIELRRRADPYAFELSAELNGEAREASIAGKKYGLQALLEADALIWELEQASAHGCARVRRVMRSSKQGAELIAERVDLNAEGVPIALRTEFWMRAGRHLAVPRAALDQTALDQTE